jgi:hypothetical protein
VSKTNGERVKLGCGSCLGPNEWTAAYGAIPGWQPVPEQTPPPMVIRVQPGWLPEADRGRFLEAARKLAAVGTDGLDDAQRALLFRTVPPPPGSVPWRPCTCNPRREAFDRGELSPKQQAVKEPAAARAAREWARRQAEPNDYA